MNLWERMSEVADRCIESEAYRNHDFYKVDRGTVEDAMSSTDPEDRHWIWLVRRMGTWLLREREVFIRGTSAYNTIEYYFETDREEMVQMYRIDMKGGSMERLDIDRFCRGMVRDAAEPVAVRMTYENGVRYIDPGKWQNPVDWEYGELVERRYLTEWEEAA